MKKVVGWVIAITIVLAIGFFVEKTKKENREHNERIIIQEGIKQ